MWTPKKALSLAPRHWIDPKIDSNNDYVIVKMMINNDKPKDGTG